MKYGFLVSLLLLFSPLTTFANITITEIMYDLSGSDEKKEWIEIYNGGDEEIDIIDWRFNDGSNHTLSGETVIFPKTYAVIASDALSLEFSRIDTVMSLNNTEATITLLNAEREVVDSVTYNSDMGAGGDGNSLQLINGLWEAKPPTPATSNVLEDLEVMLPEEKKGDEEEEVVWGNAHFNDSHIEAYAGEDMQAVVSGMVIFEGASSGLKGKPIEHARYVWNTGDGTLKEGQRVVHTYTYPGSYHVTLTVASGEYTATDRIEVFVSEADIAITFADRGRIEVANFAPLEVDISSWYLRHNGEHFQFPQNTTILPEHVAIFPTAVTHMFVDPFDTVDLLYPNGVSFHTYRKPQEQILLAKNLNLKEKEVIEVVKVIERVVEEESLAIEGNSSLPIAMTSAHNAESVEENIILPDGLRKGLTFLIVIIAVGVLGLLASTKEKRKTPLKGEDLKADDYTIIG